MNRDLHPTEIERCRSSRNSQLWRGRQLLERLTGEERETLYRRVGIFDCELLIRIENYCYSS